MYITLSVLFKLKNKNEKCKKNVFLLYFSCFFIVYICFIFCDINF